VGPFNFKAWKEAKQKLQVVRVVSQMQKLYDVYRIFLDITVSFSLRNGRDFSFGIGRINTCIKTQKAIVTLLFIRTNSIYFLFVLFRFAGLLF